MTPNVSIVAGGPDGLLGKINPDIAQRFQQRNALLVGVPELRNAAPAPQSVAGLPPAFQGQFVSKVIGHAAVLSDSPEKWAATIALLKQHGIDPQGYESFDKGRTSAIAASGVSPAASDQSQPSSGSQ